VPSPAQSRCSTRWAPGHRHREQAGGGRGITIVTGGDAGRRREISRPPDLGVASANPLPILIVVTNNKWGISTHYQGQHGEKTDQ